MSVNWAGYLTQSLEVQTWYEIAVGGAPGYIFFSTYVLLALLWTLLYATAAGQTWSLPHLRLLYVLLNVLAYSVWLTLILLMALSSPPTVETVLHPIEATYASTLALGAALFFLIGGALLWRRLRRVLVRTASRRAANRIGLLTILLTLIFSIRAILILMDIYIWKEGKDNENLASKLAFQLGCELLPAYLIFVVCGARPRALAAVIPSAPAQAPLLGDNEVN